MTGPSDWAARTAAEYATGRSLALLFDYGGTLAPTAPEPGLAVLPEVTRDLLAALAGIDRVAVGVLSGRALGHLKELVGVPGLLYAGCGGMQLDLGGEEATDPAAAEFDRLADAVVNAVAEPVRWFPGAWVERKPGCLAVHYRVLGPLKAACFRDEVQAVLADLAADAPPLRVRDRDAALEVGLAGAWTRADAVDRVLGDRGAFAVYAGDGAADTEAVERVNARGGLTVGVGPNAPGGVRAWVASPAALADDLGRLFALLSPGAGRAPHLVHAAG